MGRLADRFGVMVPVADRRASRSALGYVARRACATSLWQFALAQGLLIGVLGSSATFAPLLADTSLWFARRRGIAVAICASGNYLAGAIWPPIVQHFVETRRLAPDLLRHRRLLRGDDAAAGAGAAARGRRIRRRAVRAARSGAARDASGRSGCRPRALQALLCVAGLACCVAMSMPQVHIVAYCGDLGYGAARGAEMLSLMLGFGIVSRLVSGWICDRIGGLRTLLLGSALQGVALLLFLPFDGLVVALRDLGAVRPVPGRHRARPTRSSCASTSRRARPARASASCSWPRCSAWRSAAGCRARSST